MTRLLAIVIVLALAGAAGCGGDSGTPEPTGPPPPIAGASCRDDVGDGKQVRFGKDNYLAGVLMGHGGTGVLLAHQNQSDVCEWLPYGQELATKGYQVLAFDFNGEGASAGSVTTIAEDAAAAATYLKQQGVSKLILMGASKGGTAVLAIVPDFRADVAGVVTFSSPTAFAGVDASAVPKTLTVPALYIAGDADGRFPTEAKYFYDYTPKGLGTLLILPSSAHGTRLLLAGAQHDQLVAALDAFLAKIPPM